MLLEIQKLEAIFTLNQKRLPVVRGLDLVINEGESVGVVGESGSGKSVTAKLILGLLKSHALSVRGSIRFQGRDLMGCSNQELNRIRGREISMIFQEPMTALNPVMPVYEQVAEVLRIHFVELSEKDIEKRVFEALERVGLTLGEESRRLYPHELSGGMRQRILIAMSTISKPSLLIADEPTTALDVTVQAQILSLLRDLQREMKMSLLLISHDLAVISEMTQRLYVMYAGSCVEEGQTRSILSKRQHPYTEGLFQSIPKVSSRGERLTAMKGYLPAPDRMPSGCAFSDRCGVKKPECEMSLPVLEVKSSGQRVSCFEVK